MPAANDRVTDPRFSVVVAAYRSQRTLDTCLAALEAQTFRDFEVIVVDSTLDDASALGVIERRIGFRAHHHPERLMPHEARNLGVAMARGEILVFTDADCIAEPGWLAWLAAAHDRGHRVVGGAVRCLEGYWRWAVHCTKYGWWIPGGKPGPRPEIPSANASYDRKVLDRAGPVVADRFAGDSELSWRVRGLGEVIWYEPRAVVTHDHPETPGGFIKERYRRGLDFGSTRVESQRWSRRRCLLFVLLAPFLPALMLVRAVGHAARGGYLLRALPTIPVQVVGYTAWCAGEARVHWRHLWRR